MPFNDKIKGKITITIDKIGENLNSNIATKGLGNNPDVALTTLLYNFVLLALKNEKDPEKLIQNNLQSIVSTLKHSKGS